MLTEKHYQDLLGQIVHAYNNFLAGAIGFNELALLESQQEEVNERLALSIQSGRDAVEFGQQLLAAIGRLQVSMQPTKICDVLDKITASDFCEFKGDCKDLTMLSDPQWLQRGIESVVTFCRTFQKNCKIELSLDLRNCEPGFFKLLIKPERIQFESEIATHLFEPFYSSRQLLGNKGVGLAVVAGFVYQMRGSLEWNNQQGFVFTLPIMAVG